MFAAVAGSNDEDNLIEILHPDWTGTTSGTYRIHTAERTTFRLIFGPEN